MPVTVLCYHSVSQDDRGIFSVSPATFESHIRALAEAGYVFCSFMEAATSKDDARRVCITFDDAREGCMEAAGILERYGVCGTFFVNTGLLNGYVPPSEGYTKFISWEDVRHLAEAGHTIGSHGKEHKGYGGCSQAQIAEDLYQSRQEILQRVPQTQCEVFSAPYNSLPLRAREIVLDAGYKACAGGLEVSIHGRVDPLRVDRISVYRHWQPVDLLRHVERFIAVQPPIEFSFIIPARDEEHLQSTVDHILYMAGNSRVQVVVVDDASVVPVVLKEDPRVLVRRLDASQGVAAARNIGASIASGDTLVFTDGHVIFSRNYMEVVRDCGVSSGWGILGVPIVSTSSFAQMEKEFLTSWEVCTYDSVHCGWRYTSTFGSLLPNEGADWGQFTKVGIVGAAALAVSSSLFRRLGGFDADNLEGSGCCEDVALCLTCHYHGLEVRVACDALCWHVARTSPSGPGREGHSYASLEENLDYIRWLFDLPGAPSEWLLPDEIIRKKKKALVASAPEGFSHSKFLEAISSKPSLYNDTTPVRRSSPYWSSVDMREPEQLGFYTLLCALGFRPSATSRYQKDNGWFPLSDAAALACVVQHSPLSRYVFYNAPHAVAVALDCGVPSSSILYVGSAEALTPLLRECDRGVTVFEGPLQQMSPEPLLSLSEGDILFLDTSHSMSDGGDVAYVLSCILPRLCAGVRVHFHDVFHEFTYPPEWEDCKYTESQCLAAVLSMRGRLRIEAFNNYAGTTFSDLFEEKFPEFLHNKGGSLWLRVADAPAEVDEPPHWAWGECAAYTTIANAIYAYSRRVNGIREFPLHVLGLSRSYFSHTHATGAHDFVREYLIPCGRGRYRAASAFTRDFSWPPRLASSLGE